MTHFESRERAEKQDRLAIDRIIAMDPEGLYRTVEDHGITMCGYIPAVVMLGRRRGRWAQRGRTSWRTLRRATSRATTRASSGTRASPSSSRMDFFFSTSTLSVMAAIGAAALAGYLVGRVRRARRGGTPRRAEFFRRSTFRGRWSTSEVVQGPRGGGGDGSGASGPRCPASWPSFRTFFET